MMRAPGVWCRGMLYRDQQGSISEDSVEGYYPASVYHEIPGEHRWCKVLLRFQKPLNKIRN